MVLQHIAFRTDASNQIGTGHFMRCLTLAEALKKHGAKIRFVSSELPVHLHDMLAAKDIELASLDSNTSTSPTGDLAHAHWLRSSQKQDAHATINALSDELWDWLIVDHYALDTRWESLLRQTAKKIVVIDDLADRHHDCDILLDQNYYADMKSRYIGKVPTHCQLLLGPHYALLRDEFRQLHEQIKPRSGAIKRVLVFLGGIDAHNCTGRAIEALANIPISELYVDVVIGELHPCREQIESSCIQHGFTCHVQTNKMAKLMMSADLAIGAGGSTTWERCCCGLPSLVISLAENQVEMTRHCANEGILYYLGSGNDLTRSIVRAALETFLHSKEARISMARKGRLLVDPMGCQRVISTMLPSSITLRKATINDCGDIYKWRNDPFTRKYLFNSNPISIDIHSSWFESSLNNPKRYLLIGEQLDQAIGLFRIDVESNFAWISVYLVPGLSGHGFGTQLTKAGCIWVKNNLKKVNSLRAKIIPHNKPSLQMFLGCGFVEHHRDLRLLLT